MTPVKRQNLQRLLKPRHVAVVGGADGEMVINQCQRIGFKGLIWPVNPKRDRSGGLKCYPAVEHLPEPPDAVFLAVPAKPAVEVISRLENMGAGGVVCYTAGFGADGKEGGTSDQPVVDVVGDMALVGPNCYGLINYMDRVALWPFPHGGFNPGYGVAIITQSGMLSSDITMNQRSLPLAYMISTGNQSVLKLEDYIEVLCEKKEVHAIGLHIEGLKDITSFSRVARKVLALNKPIVVLKTGTSKIGAQLTISHTGSLSGSNELYQALFDRLGIISVTSPAQFIETLKFICVSGLPKGNNLMGFTCSGGGATMLADYGEKIGVSFPAPSAIVTDHLIEKLPKIASVSNPLDYTTPIWGVAEKTRPVFTAALDDNYDAVVIVQDYPLPEFGESKKNYLNDAEAFATVTAGAGLPAAVCSTLSENIDRQTREFLIGENVTPLQGIHEGLNAIRSAAWYGQQRKFVLSHISSDLAVSYRGGKVEQIDEWSSKQSLKAAGIPVPDGRLVSATAAANTAEEIGFPVVVKLNAIEIAHKTEIGAVVVGLGDRSEVQKAIVTMQANIEKVNPRIAVDSFLIEKLAPKPVAELMLDIRHDHQFGLVMTLATGGTFVELIADAVSMILPVSGAEILIALNKLKIAPLLNGFRGGPTVEKDKLIKSIEKVAEYVTVRKDRIAELEINPLFVYPDRCIVVDSLTQQYHVG